MLPNDKPTFVRQVKSLKESGIISIRRAESAVRAILYLWQKRSFPGLAETQPPRIKKYISDPHIQLHAQWICEKPFLEGAFWLSSTYAVLIGKELQSHFAMYFTPPVLANRLIDNLLSRGASLIDHRWKDPACGGGAFLVPVAVRMIEEMRVRKLPAEEIVQMISRNLLGSDIDRLLAALSTAFIQMAMYREIVESKYQPDLQISVADSLLLEARNKQPQADVVICNPPYRKMTREELLPYRENFADIIGGQPNIYGLFIQQCVYLAAASGLVGLLTPTSYLSGQNFSKLRLNIVKSTSILQLDLIREKEGVFLGVEQEAVLSVLRLLPVNPVPLTEVFTLSSLAFNQIGTCQVPSDSCAWPVPRDDADTAILGVAGKSPYRIGDYGYTIKTGAYVDYRDERETYMSKPSNKRMKAVFPLIWSSDITTDGQLQHGRTSKQDRHPTFIEMTDPAHRSVVRGGSLALQRVTSADQEKRLVGAPVPQELIDEFGGVVGENHVLFLEWTNPDHGVDPAVLGQLLRAHTVDRLFRCISGAVNVSIYELEQLPLPAPDVLRTLLSRTFLKFEALVEEAYLLTIDLSPANSVMPPQALVVSPSHHKELHARNPQRGEIFLPLAQ